MKLKLRVARELNNGYLAGKAQSQDLIRQLGLSDPKAITLFQRRPWCPYGNCA